MLKQLSQRQKTGFTILIASIVLAGGIWLSLSLQNRFSAEEGDSATADLFVHIEQNGQPAVGMLQISNGCDASPLPSQEGSFTCLLKAKNDPNTIGLTAVYFSDFNANYSLPVVPRSDIQRPIAIPNGAKLYLRSVITDNAVELFQTVNGEEINITATGIQI